MNRGTKLNTILANGSRIYAADYKAKPSAYQELLQSAKMSPGFALCECNFPNPKLVIRIVHSSYGKVVSLATWPNQGYKHNPDCSFYVSDLAYRQTELLREAQEKSDAKAFAVGNKTLSGTLKYFFEPGGNRLPNAQSWTAVQEHIESVLNKYASLPDSPSKSIYVVPTFAKEKKDAISKKWSDFYTAHPLAAEGANHFFVLGEIKSVQRFESSVVTLLRNFKTALFMNHTLANELSRSNPSVNAALAGGASLATVVGIFRVTNTSFGNLWVDDAALLVLPKAR